MTNIKAIFAAALCGAAVFAAPAAQAAEVPFTLRGVFSGSIDDVAFSGRSLTFTALADDQQLEDVFGETSIGLTSVSIGDGTANWTLIDPARFFFNPSDGLGGIVDQYATLGLVRFTYTGSTAPMSVGYYGNPLSGAFATSGGLLRIDGGQGMSLETSFASIPAATAAAVPEPTTWAMMMIGFAVAGGALRMRSLRRMRVLHAAG